jgi:hypothetical protein
MMEIVVAALAVGLEDRRSTHGETLIRSACETLTQTPPALIAAVTLSLPASEPVQADRLQKMACSLAAQCEFDASVTVEESHISVRFTRRQDCGGCR